MMTLISGLWSKVYGYVIAIGGVLAILAAAYAKGRADQKVNQSVKDLKAVKTAREIEDDVKNLGSNDLDTELSKWLRDR